MDNSHQGGGPYQMEMGGGHAESPQPSQPRRRKPEGYEQEETEPGGDPALYTDLERLRYLVDGIDGDNRGSGCFRLSLDNSMMSTIFGLVFVVILTVTFYAFFSLYKAISKRFFS